MIFVKDDNKRVYLKGTDIELSASAITEIAKQALSIIEGEVDTLPHINSKNAKVLKSFRSEEGAKFWVDTQKKMGKLTEEKLIITKSLGGYSEVMYQEEATHIPPMPTHVVIEEDLADVTEVIAVKGTDDMFKMMYKKGLIEVHGGMISFSEKMYTLLNKFTENVLADTLKYSEMDERGRVIGEVATEVLKASGGEKVTPDGKGKESGVKAGSKETSAPKLTLTEEEASNTDGGGKSVKEDGVGPIPSIKTSKKEAPNLSMTQEEADNNNSTPEPISDATAKSKFGDTTSVTKNTVSDEEYAEKPEDEAEEESDKVTEETKAEPDVQKSYENMYFKSLSEVNSYVRNNPEYVGRATNMNERFKVGKRFGFVAEPRPSVEATGAYGSRKHTKN